MSLAVTKCQPRWWLAGGCPGPGPSPGRREAQVKPFSSGCWAVPAASRRSKSAATTPSYRSPRMSCSSLYWLTAFFVACPGPDRRVRRRTWTRPMTGRRYLALLQESARVFWCCTCSAHWAHSPALQALCRSSSVPRLARTAIAEARRVIEARKRRVMNTRHDPHRRQCWLGLADLRFLLPAAGAATYRRDDGDHHDQ